MDIIQDLKYIAQEIMIEEEDLNALDKWIRITGEMIARVYDLVEMLKAFRQVTREEGCCRKEERRLVEKRVLQAKNGRKIQDRRDEEDWKEKGYNCK